MNKVKYDQTEGFPLDVNILDFGQKANQISQQLGEIIAPLAIVSGCVENGNNVSDGVVYIDGEILPFTGGLKQSQIRIVETTEQREFENGNSKDVLITRYATFGIGAVKSYNWSDFYRSITIKEIEKRLVHVGFIQDYCGDINNIPSGWYLCDGNNGTPDLRGLFVVGYDSRNTDYNTIGKRGGASTVTLTADQMPRHTHGGSSSAAGDHQHHTLAWAQTTENDVGANNYASQDDNGHWSSQKYKIRGTNTIAGAALTSASGSHSHTMNLDNAGNSEAHENRPPFYVLAKIMYKG